MMGVWRKNTANGAPENPRIAPIPPPAQMIAAALTLLSLAAVTAQAGKALLPRLPVADGALHAHARMLQGLPQSLATRDSSTLQFPDTSSGI